MLRAFFICAIAFTLAVRTGAAEPREISGREAEAVALALKLFKSKQGSKDQSGHPVYGDLQHYTIELRRDGIRLEVAFVPGFGPKDKGPDGTHTLGGATQYGWAVVYVISLDKMKIVDEHYAR
jgi:hypothetical protein